eukprot:scaffold8581_cov109-Isochrysis_galbana.AAC.3
MRTGLPCTQSSSTSGAREGVTVRTMPAAWHASRGVAATVASHPSARSSAASACAWAARRAHTTTARQAVTAASIRSWYRACTPQPSTPIHPGRRGAKRRAASAPAAAVRSSVRSPPSRRTARGAKVYWEKTSIKPEFRPAPPEAIWGQGQGGGGRDARAVRPSEGTSGALCSSGRRRSRRMRNQWEGPDCAGGAGEGG